jgi:hypothetical protein
VVEGGIAALSSAFPQWPTLRSANSAPGHSRLAWAAAGRAADHPDGTIRWDIPVPDPE